MTNGIQVTLEQAIYKRNAIVSKLQAENAKDLQDETLIKVLGPCVLGKALIKAAQILRDDGMITQQDLED